MDPLSDPMSSDKELPNDEIGTNWNKNRKNCPNCQEVFETTSEKLKHVAMMHPATKIYSCSHCDKKYINIRSLDNHEKKFHGLSTSKGEVISEGFFFSIWFSPQNKNEPNCCALAIHT